MVLPAATKLPLLISIGATIEQLDPMIEGLKTYQLNMILLS